jgi:hypothetical protein
VPPSSPDRSAGPRSVILILPFLAVAVLVLVGVDVFITVFHPE